MKMRHLPLALAFTLSACAWFQSPPSVPVEDDKSVVFPQFFERDALTLGATGEPYELDGETLRAITIAANDFLPPGDQNTPCWRRRESQFYRIIRQQNIIFIYIHENHEHCGRAYPALDSGAKYAISTDGRILRRIRDGQEGGPFDVVTPEKADAGFFAEPGTSPTFEATWNTPDASAPVTGQDGGHPSSPSDSPAVPSSVSDGGASGVH
jgi:hypothetical protein